VAVAGEKNNTSLLSFFAKSGQQKRPAASAQSEIVSHFLINRKLRACNEF
jgi:hypothetical protein